MSVQYWHRGSVGWCWGAHGAEGGAEDGAALGRARELRGTVG